VAGTVTVASGYGPGGEVRVGYARRHPRAARVLTRVMGNVVDGSMEDYRALGRATPFLRFVPRG
jgi:hypothetical protein